MAVTIRVRVQPGAVRDEVSGWQQDTLRVRLRARAVEGKANRSLLDFLAACLGLRPYQVELLRGERSREKLVQVDLSSADEVLARLSAGDKHGPKSA